MKPMIRWTAILLAGAATVAVAAEGSPCRDDPRASGMNERMENMKSQMSVIERTTDRAEQRRLMEIHMKVMHDSMRELRRRDADERCRIEVMHTMMEQMMRHQLVEQDSR